MTSSQTVPAIPSQPSTTAHFELGRRGEQLAAAYLEQQGFAIVAANFILPVGRNMRGVIINAEIDLVAYEGPTLCFVEVKTRASDWFAPPQSNVDLRKQRQIARAARAYRRLLGLEGMAYRYDVVSIVLPTAVDRTTAPHIEILRGFWTEEKLRKRHWSERYWD
ncbi:MAG: putative endonuclease, archaeal Holliday junction resolvase like protein [Acidobacteria bacterium]|nr:putative endonuclease, archaeal Holliday junction resolvase like protein [Acidobacteriota bacterium]